MSGSKKMTIDQTEYNRLRREAAKATSAQRSADAMRHLNMALERDIASSRRDLQRINSNLSSLDNRISRIDSAATERCQQLRQQLQSSIASMNADLKRESEKTNVRIDSLKNSFQSELNNTKEDLKRIIERDNSALRDEMSQMDRSYQQRFRETDQRIDGIEAGLDRINSDNETLLGYAREYYSAAAAVMDSASQFRCELLMPGELERTMQTLNDASSDIALTENVPGNSAVARSSALNAYKAAVTFYQGITKTEQEWALRLAAARKRLAAAMAQITACQSFHIDEENVDINTDFWSNGELTSILDNAEQLQAALDSPDNLSIQDLDMIAEHCELIHADAQNAAAHAAGAAVQSQNRYDIARAVSSMLRENYGLTLREGDYAYQGEDYRGAYRLRMSNSVNGHEVVVTLSPQVAEDGSITMCAECETINYDTNDTERGREIAREAGEAVMSIVSGGSGEYIEDPRYVNTVSPHTEHTNITEWRTETKAENIPAFTDLITSRAEVRPNRGQQS